MKLNKTKLEMKMAKACMNPYDVAEKAGLNYQTVRKATNGTSLKPKTAGLIAAALGVDVSEIVEMGD